MKEESPLTLASLQTLKAGVNSFLGLVQHVMKIYWAITIVHISMERAEQLF